MSTEPPALDRPASVPPAGTLPATAKRSVPEVPSTGNGSAPPGGTAGGGGGGGGGGEPGGRPRHGARRWVVEWLVILLVAVGVAIGVRTFVVQTYYVPSTSMWPTLKAGDRIVVDKLSGAIHTGDIIVFKRPPAEHCGGPPVPDLVKRVIGLPGQTVSAHGGQVYITGKLLKEPWLPTHDPRTYTTMTGSFHVPRGDYFVMGDNRVDSCDSRMWGPVKSSYVVGKVFLILWPPSRIRFF